MTLPAQKQLDTDSYSQFRQTLEACLRGVFLESFIITPLALFVRSDMAEKKPEEYLKQLNMPNLCARCGREPGESAWTIYSRYNFSFKITRTTYKKSRFHVPVCNSCKIQLEKDNTTWLRISWVSGIGIFLMLVLTILIYEQAVLFLVLSLLSLTVLIIAYIKLSKYWRDSDIAAYDGEYFTFNNKTFHEKFKELNPLLVKKT